MRDSVSDQMNDLSRLEVRQEGAAYEYRCLVCSVVERRTSSVGSLCRKRGSRDRTWWMIRTPRTRTQPCTILPSSRPRRCGPQRRRRRCSRLSRTTFFKYTTKVTISSWKCAYCIINLLDPNKLV